jgi:hypothetical protein
MYIKTMDRKVCVLLYSQYSQASKSLFDHIKSLPFDLIQITGMTLLSVDSEEIRKMVSANGIKSVPSLLFQYFDDTKMILEGQDIYGFIDSVASSLNVQDKPIVENVSEYIKPKKNDVMAIAMEMKNKREQETPIIPQIVDQKFKTLL